MAWLPFHKQTNYTKTTNRDYFTSISSFLRYLQVRPSDVRQDPNVGKRENKSLQSRDHASRFCRLKKMTSHGMLPNLNRKLLLCYPEVRKVLKGTKFWSPNCLKSSPIGCQSLNLEVLIRKEQNVPSAFPMM